MFVVCFLSFFPLTILNLKRQANWTFPSPKTNVLSHGKNLALIPQISENQSCISGVLLELSETKHKQSHTVGKIVS